MRKKKKDGKDLNTKKKNKEMGDALKKQTNPVGQQDLIIPEKRAK